MKLKNYIPIILISAGIGFVFGRYSIENTQNYIMPILPWALLVSATQLAFNILWGFYQNNRADKIKKSDKLEQEKTKKQEMKEKNKLEHSERLVNYNISY